MPGAILTLNAGSSSIKFALFDAALKRNLHGEIEKIDSVPHVQAFDAKGALQADHAWPERGHEALLGKLITWLEERLEGTPLLAAGHRIVHGGEDFIHPTRLNDVAIAALSLLSPLAPLHQPHNLGAVQALAVLRPGLLQVGCFDTAFHHAMPAAARRFGLPRAMEQDGIRRYGFHGLSYEFIAGRLAQIAPAAGRIIVAHLGAGASLCAMQNGKSIDTSMGFTPLDGLLMGTRCGALDPGVLLYLMEKGWDRERLEDLLYRRSGLLGVSGSSGDMRVLLAGGNIQAEEAVDLFVFRVAREIGAMAASLGGLDGLVFTGGIGANSAEIRARIAARAGWLGLTLDDAANRGNETCISRPGDKVRAWAIQTDEEIVIARHTMALAAGTRIAAQ